MALLDVNIDANGIALVMLNRPEKRNALSFQLLQQLIDTAKQLKKNKRVRCIILTGSAQVFSAGIDLADLNNPKHKYSSLWQLIKPGQSLFQKACLTWQSLPIPVIAAIDGYCFGAGLQLALGCDIRIATADCQFSIMESRWGLVPDMGLSHSLKGLIGIDIAKELTFSARIFDGNYAKEIGLISHVDKTPLQRAQQLAQECVQRSPDALFAAKQVLNAMLHRPRCALALEKYYQLRLILGKNSQLSRKKDKHPETQFIARQL